MKNIVSERDKLINEISNIDVLRLGEIVRYNNRTKIKHENVAEHSLYVCSTIIKICNLYGIDAKTKSKALEFGVTHDFGEIYVNDIPYDTKRDNPELNQILEDAEVSSLEKYMPIIAPIYSQFLLEEKRRTVAYLIAKIGDATSVTQYSKREIELGNKTEEMQSIYYNSIIRINGLIDELETKLGDK